MRLLCVSDIHGRLDALAAVLATAERRSFNKLLVAGDIVFPGPAPLETWRRLVSAGAVMVQGVSDKALATLDPTDLHASNEHEHQMIERMRAARAELGDLILERLKRLPTHVRKNLSDAERTRIRQEEALPQLTSLHNWDAVNQAFGLFQHGIDNAFGPTHFPQDLAWMRPLPPVMSQARLAWVTAPLMA